MVGLCVMDVETDIVTDDDGDAEAALDEEKVRAMEGDTVELIRGVSDWEADTVHDASALGETEGVAVTRIDADTLADAVPDPGAE